MNSGRLYTDLQPVVETRVCAQMWGKKPLVRGHQIGCGLLSTQSYTHVIHIRGGVFLTSSTGLSTGVVAVCCKDAQTELTTENAKRPSAGTRRPLLIHPLATTNGGTMGESNDGKHRAAVAHLNLIRVNPTRAAYFVRLAYVYGVTVPEIVAESSLPVDVVRRMVLGGDRG